MRPHAVVLFTGDARREEAQKGLPRRFLARLHDELGSVVRSMGDVDLYLASDKGGTFRVDGPAFVATASPHEPLGEKVELALSRCFAEGYARVAIVAGDLAGLTRGLLCEAFESLSHTTSVVGKSPDGGFYLAAFSAQPEVSWTSLPWSTDALYEALVGQLRNPHELPLLQDIDSFGDALRAVRAVDDAGLRDCLLSILLARTTVVSELRSKPYLGLRGTDRLRGPPAAQCASPSHK